MEEHCTLARGETRHRTKYVRCQPDEIRRLGLRRRNTSSQNCTHARDTVLAQVYRAQADALLIESRAKMRLAEEYDAAQERGEVGKRGDFGGVTSRGEDTPTVADIGLTHKDIYEARQIRDAEAVDPGITKRTLNEIVERGDEPTKAKLNREIIKQKPAAIILIAKQYLPRWQIFT